jgi:hypothetical protein
VPQGVGPQLKSFGHFLLWSALDEHGPQRLVTTVIRVVRMKEKLATAHIVHDRPPWKYPSPPWRPTGVMVRSGDQEIDVSSFRALRELDASQSRPFPSDSEKNGVPARNHPTLNPQKPR